MAGDARIRITKAARDDELGRAIEPRMKNFGQALGARMQRTVPKRSWALHDTIDEVTERNGAKVTTSVSAGGGDVDYALAVERGTSRQAAQPYMRPALMQASSRDLDYSGKGITRHGVISPSTRRTRARARAGR